MSDDDWDYYLKKKDNVFHYDILLLLLLLLLSMKFDYLLSFDEIVVEILIKLVKNSVNDVDNSYVVIVQWLIDGEQVMVNVDNFYLVNSYLID